MARIAKHGPAAQRVNSAEEAPKAYLVGGGIASMAAAAFLIRDGDVLGRDITILEESDVIGGSLDGSGTRRNGYVLRGGRMFESKYVCTFELFSSIPALDGDQNRHPGDFRLERDSEDLVEIASHARRPSRGRAQVRPERKSDI